ncbi:MAG: hypothetical protein WCX61_05635 [Candidatus Peribacteraceae bacterium]
MIPGVHRRLVQQYPEVEIATGRLHRIAEAIRGNVSGALDVRLSDLHAAMKVYTQVANDSLRTSSQVNASRTLLSITSQTLFEFWSNFVMTPRLPFCSPNGKRDMHSEFGKYTGVWGLDMTDAIMREYDRAACAGDLQSMKFHAATLNGKTADGKGRLPFGVFTTVPPHCLTEDIVHHNAGTERFDEVAGDVLGYTADLKVKGYEQSALYAAKALQTVLRHLRREGREEAMRDVQHLLKELG